MSHDAPRHPLGRAGNLERPEGARPKGWKNPNAAGTYNLVVLGAGPAGLAAARDAAVLGAKVALIERHLIGGDCVNVGCVPSKTLIRTSRSYADMRDAANFGARTQKDILVDFSLAMARLRRIRSRINRAVSVERLTGAGIDLFFGEARFDGPSAVLIEGQRLRFNKALVATGARPRVPAIPGLDQAGYLTNETVFELTRCSPSLLVIGGGPLGCEAAQAFCRLGLKVIIAQGDAMFLPGEERDAAQILSDALASDGVEIHLNTRVVAVRMKGGRKVADLVSDDLTTTVEVDEILVGIGRSPNVEGLNLEAAGIEYDTVTGIRVDDFLRTTNRCIYAAGDVCLEHKFTHTAEATARMAVKNALLFGRKRLSALTIPWCTYTDPEIAHVGLYVIEARRKAIPVKTFTILMHDVDRAVTDGEEEGFVKIHVKEGTDRIVGATVVARHAGEMISGLSLAIGSGIGLRALANVTHAYPTQTAAIKMAADAYRRTRWTRLRTALTQRWLSWARR